MGLASALADGNCVLFVGAGIGHNTRKASGDSVGSGVDLRDALAAEFGLEITDADDLAIISQVIEINHDRSKLVSALETLLADLQPDDDLQWLLSLPWKAIFTTNYDNVLERCYELNANPTQVPVVMGANSEVKTWQPPFEVPLIHLHGGFQSEAAKDAILVTQSDYSRFRERRQMLFDHLRLQYASSPIVYVGYSNRDPNWRTVIEEVEAQFSPGEAPTSYRITPTTSNHERIVLQAARVHALDGTISELREVYAAYFGDDSPPRPPESSSVSDRIPTELIEIFKENPAGTIRLLNSWEYVNQASFSEDANTYEFRRGDRPNWGLLGQGLSFERDLESFLVDRLIDFVTEPEAAPRCEIVLSPAGYGITTLLLSVATWFARQRLSTTLLLRPGQEPVVADVEFAVKHLPGPIILVVDDAADYSARLDEVWQFIRDSRMSATLLLGERSNEWRQTHSRLKPLEHELSPLSDDEIERLLASLEKTGDLGYLNNLSQELRFAAVKERNQKDLLVTMREVTEGRGFDAIIEDEFRSIQSAAAQELYGLVCCFSRVRALARDFLLIDALDSVTSDFYKLVTENLHGIVQSVVVDESRGIYALTCRHRVIADIVWYRCFEAAERRDYALRALAKINLTFGIDAKAFEAFTRDDKAVDSLDTFDAKSQFFEDACRKNPRDAYVRQHYARMLRREHKYELALSQIETAVRLKPSAKVIEHTRGVILADLAIGDSTPQIRRKRLAQSEAAFRVALKANRRDDYSYRSLADLYLDWAKKCTSNAEAAEYATKAQNVVIEGLRYAYNSDGLYIASAEIEEYLGNTPERVEALRLAVDEAPDSRIARYLLGVVLHREGEIAEAKKVLEQGLVKAPEDAHLALAYALVLHQDDPHYGQPISTLRLAEFAGSRQPRFLATLGGMLVMNKDFDAANQVWQRCWDANFSVADRHRTQFVPRPGGGEVELRGEVIEVGSGRARISAPGYREFHCGGSQFSGLVLKRGLGVVFKPAFCARGPVALQPRLA